MTRCREIMLLKTIGPGNNRLGIELSCDLDEHEKILDFHYDKLNQVEWRHPLEPVGVPATRTTPPKAAKAKAAKVSNRDIILAGMRSGVL